MILDLNISLENELYSFNIERPRVYGLAKLKPCRKPLDWW